MLLLCTFSKPKVVCGKFKYISESERADSSRHRSLIHEFELILLMFSKGKSISINWEMEKPRSSSVHSLQRIILVKNARLVLRLKWSVLEGKFPMPFRSRSALDASKVFCLKKKRKESRESKSRVCCLIDALNCRFFFSYRRLWIFVL